MEIASQPWLAHKTEYSYFLLQPSLPPREVMVVRGVVQVTLRGVPLATCFVSSFGHRPYGRWLVLQL
jgi:hypothetical protein